MTPSQLEYYLEKGNHFGLNIGPTAAGRIAWIILSKEKPVERFFERFTAAENPGLYARQVERRDYPYQLWTAEILIEVFESDRFPSHDDYLINERSFFALLDEVADFLKKRGIQLDDLKWATDIKSL